MLSVWGTNASLIGKDAEEFERIPFHQTDVTAGFLSRDDKRLFICGLKGVGKTLLLKRKSVVLRQSHSGVTISPPTELVEKLNPLAYSMSAGDQKDLSVPTGWSRVWQFAISMAILRRLSGTDALGQYETPAALNVVFNRPDSSVSYHLQRLISQGPHVRRELVEQHSPDLLAGIRQIRSGFAAFVDAIDDCVYSHVGSDLKLYETAESLQFGVLSQKIWSSAQVGFVQAAMALHEANRHVKIFGALRREALDAHSISDRQNMDAYLLSLEYSREDLRGIFRTKLTALRERSPGAFSAEPSGDLVRDFFGIRSMVHPSVTAADWGPVEEDVLDYVIRHTRGRPRELDMIGESLQLIAVRPRPAQEIRRRVREKSRLWFDWAKSEVVPYWKESYDELLKGLPSNVLSRAEMDSAINASSGPAETRAAFLDLFELGLVGCPVLDDTKCESQRFRQNDPDLPVDKEHFDAATHIVIHPCVNLATRTASECYSANPHNIVGHGYPFVRVDHARHVHFGAGALGLGLVLPVLVSNSGTSICIVQRPSERWATLAGEHDWCDIESQHRSDGEMVPRRRTVLRARVISDRHTEAELAAEVQRWSAGDQHVLVVSENHKVVESFVTLATSISTAVRHLDSLRAIGQLIRNCARSTRAVFPFENNKEAVGDFRKILDDQSVTVVSVVADRICLSPSMKGDRIVAETEDYYSVVLNDASPYSRSLFGAALRDDRHNVTFQADIARFGLAQETKRCLVNGLHFAYFVYAFRLLSRDFPDRPDLIETLMSEPVGHLLAPSPDVQSGLDAVANLCIIHLLVFAEERSIAASQRDLSKLHEDVGAVYDRFVDRLTATRDHLQRLVARRVVSERFERFVEPFEGLHERLAKTKYCRVFLEGLGYTGDRVRAEALQYRADCSVLLKYAREPESPRGANRPTEGSRSQGSKRRGTKGR